MTLKKYEHNIYKIYNSYMIYNIYYIKNLNLGFKLSKFCNSKSKHLNNQLHLEHLSHLYRKFDLHMFFFLDQSNVFS